MVILQYLWNILYNPLGNAVLGDRARKCSFRAELFSSMVCAIYRRVTSCDLHPPSQVLNQRLSGQIGQAP